MLLPNDVDVLFTLTDRDRDGGLNLNVTGKKHEKQVSFSNKTGVDRCYGVDRCGYRHGLVLAGVDRRGQMKTKLESSGVDRYG